MTKNLNVIFLKRQTLNHGTTTANYYGPSQKKACKVLAYEVHKAGQRVLMGKLSKIVGDSTA